MNYQITETEIKGYQEYLHQEEHSAGTIEKYIRDVNTFSRWLRGQEADREHAAEWKMHLLSCGYAPVTINSMLSSLNGFYRYMRWEECRVKFLHIQRRLFREQAKELNQAEYERLLKAARDLGRDRLGILMEAICNTGIRVSEVSYITVEAVRRGQAEISLKGKIRTILFPTRLCRKLLKYARKQNIRTGEIFRTRNGTGLSRRQIWREMKALCRHAGVEESKVFPHNLRHLFAVTFHRVCRDIAKLADVLGHTSMETTRLYLISSGKEHIRHLNHLGLIT